MCLGMTLDSSILMVVNVSIVCCLPRPACVPSRSVCPRYATDRGVYLTELSKKLLDLKSGAKVITVDKRLQGPFNLIT